MESFYDSSDQKYLFVDRTILSLVILVPFSCAESYVTLMILMSLEFTYLKAFWF